MPIALKTDNDHICLTLSGISGAEEAEELLEKLLEHPDAVLDLAACEHFHAAVLQVILACGCQISAPPENHELQQALNVIPCRVNTDTGAGQA